MQPKDRKWQSLNAAERAAVRALGWRTQQEWDAFQDTQDKRALTSPLSWLLSWAQLDPSLGPGHVELGREVSAGDLWRADRDAPKAQPTRPDLVQRV